MQDVSVIEQEKVDKLMLDMDGTENKCKMCFFFFLSKNNVSNNVCLLRGIPPKSIIPIWIVFFLHKFANYALHPLNTKPRCYISEMTSQ